MSVLDALQAAAVRIIKRKPTVFYNSAQPFEVELCDLATDVARDIAKGHDWQRLIGFATVAGDGVETSFALPDDYDRMLNDSELQDTENWAWGYERILDLNEFTYRTNSGFIGVAPGAWTIYGGSLRFVPAPDGDATYPYVSKNFADHEGTPQDKFTADNDTFLIDDRLLTLGIVWRWREQNRLEYQGDFNNFNRLFTQLASKDKGARLFRTRSRSRGNFGVAYPYGLGP